MASPTTSFSQPWGNIECQGNHVTLDYQGGANGCPAEFAFLSEIASHLPDPQICYSQADFAQGATNTGCGSWCCKDDSCSAGCGVLACADFTLPASTSKGARRPLRDRSECRGQRRGADVLSLGQLRTAFSD